MIRRVYRVVHSVVHRYALPGVIRLKTILHSRRMDVDELDKVLIIAPHPDDETFGCGMLIKELCDRHKDVTVLILSKGEAAQPPSAVSREELVEVRRRLAEEATSNLGLNGGKLFFLDFPDSRFSETPQGEIARLVDFVGALNPRFIFSPHPWEYSNDHTATVKILRKALSGIDAVRYYYCVWFHDHLPARYALRLDFGKSRYLEGDIQTKRSSMDIYVDAKSPEGHYYSCKLPKLMLRGTGYRKEFYFEEMGLDPLF